MRELECNLPPTLMSQSEWHLKMKTVKHLTWNEVAMRRGSRAAVRISSEGMIRSVLCGGPNHSDEISDDSVDYSIPDRPYYSKVLASFKETLLKKGAFDVY